jgi:hypothetical protein
MNSGKRSSVNLPGDARSKKMLGTNDTNRGTDNLAFGLARHIHSFIGCWITWPDGSKHFNRYYQQINSDEFLEFWGDAIGQDIFEPAVCEINNAFIKCRCESCCDYVYNMYPSEHPEPQHTGPCQLLVCLRNLCTSNGTTAPEPHSGVSDTFYGPFMSDGQIWTWWDEIHKMAASAQLDRLRVVAKIIDMGRIAKRIRVGGDTQEDRQEYDRLQANMLDWCWEADSSSTDRNRRFSSWLLSMQKMLDTNLGERDYESVFVWDISDEDTELAELREQLLDSMTGGQSYVINVVCQFL